MTEGESFSPLRRPVGGAELPLRGNQAGLHPLSLTLLQCCAGPSGAASSFFHILLEVVICRRVGATRKIHRSQMTWLTMSGRMRRCCA